MPPVFKALATITVWAMWICAWVAFLVPLVMGTLAGDLFVVGVIPPLYYPIMWALAFAGGILAVCAMKLRQMLE